MPLNSQHKNIHSFIKHKHYLHIEEMCSVTANNNAYNAKKTEEQLLL